MKILIAANDRNNRHILAKELSGRGFDIDQVENGSMAMDLLERQEYDVVLLDLNMPGSNGMDVLKKIRSLDVSA